MDQSKGLCVKWDCPLESSWINPLPIAIEICDLVVTVAQKQALGAIDRRLLAQSQMSCVRDLQLTFDSNVIKDSISLLLHRIETCYLFVHVVCSNSHRPRSGEQHQTASDERRRENGASFCGQDGSCETSSDC